MTCRVSTRIGRISNRTTGRHVSSSPQNLHLVETDRCSSFGEPSSNSMGYEQRSENLSRSTVRTEILSTMRKLEEPR